MKNSALQTMSFFNYQIDYDSLKIEEHDIRLKEKELIVTGLRIKLKKWIE